MPGASLVSSELIAAYRATEYRVELGQGRAIVLRIGLHSAALAALHRERQVTSSAFITACNPYSQPLPDRQNQARQAALGEALAQCGLACLPAAGVDPSAQWPAEPGFLALGIGLDPALALARRFEQNALVFCDASAIPALRLCR